MFAQSFASPTTYPGSQPFDGDLGDFNGDGKPDLAVANNLTSNISVLLGNGDGTFGTKTDYDVGQPADGVVITDLNSDGKLDIVAQTSFSLTASVSVLLGNGNGTFQARVDYLFGVCHNLHQFSRAISITIPSPTSWLLTAAAPQSF